jgi:NADPH-dependent curcumin reductase CurA
VVFDYADRYHLAIAEMAGYIKDGRKKSKENVVVGLDTFPETLLKLFNGENFGKLVLEVAKDLAKQLPRWQEAATMRPHFCHHP